MHLQNFSAIAVETYLVLVTLIGLLVGAFSKSSNVNRYIYVGSIIALFSASIFLLSMDFLTGSKFNNSIINDDFSLISKFIILVTIGVVLITSYRSLINNELMLFEFPLLILCSTVGMMIMVSCQDLLVLFVGLELQALPLYILAAFKRNNLRSSEAGLKFFLLGALSSGLLLYGCSLIYGATGSTHFSEINFSVNSENSWIILVGLGFIISGLSFKLSVVPFHMWAPDVYEGSPTPTTLLLASAPKLAAIAMTARLLILGFEEFLVGWQQILVVLSIFSIFFGSIAAIAQTNMKRLLAYSSISHMGFAIIGLASASPEGVAALMWYMIIYIVMTLGIFTFVLNMESGDIENLNINELSGLSKKSPNKAMLLTFLICSMAGLPPFIGFFAKYFIFLAAVNAGFVLVVVLAVIGSVLGSFVYLRLVYLIYFGKSESTSSINMSKIEYIIFAFSALFMILGSVSFFGLDVSVQSASQSFF